MVLKVPQLNQSANLGGSMAEVATLSDELLIAN